MAQFHSLITHCSRVLIQVFKAICRLRCSLSFQSHLMFSRFYVDCEKTYVDLCIFLHKFVTYRPSQKWLLTMLHSERNFCETFLMLKPRLKWAETFPFTTPLSTWCNTTAQKDFLNEFYLLFIQMHEMCIFKCTAKAKNRKKNNKEDCRARQVSEEKILIIE